MTKTGKLSVRSSSMLRPRASRYGHVGLENRTGLTQCRERKAKVQDTQSMTSSTTSLLERENGRTIESRLKSKSDMVPETRLHSLHGLLMMQELA